MTMYAILNSNDNNKLLRYSTAAQSERTYNLYNRETNTTSIIHEICVADVEYSQEYIGKSYNLNTKTVEN